MVSRIARAILVLVGLAGCGPVVGNGVIDLSVVCLERHPGFAGCCDPGFHIDDGFCCPDGDHTLTDVEHADWKICVPDENPADVGTDAPPDAGADAE